MRRLLAAALCVLLIPRPAAARQPWSDVQLLITQRKMADRFNGNVLIARGGKVEYQQAVGYSHIANQKKLVIDQQFVIASLSKQITAALVLQQVSQGHIDLQVPIRRYLPQQPDTWADSVTVHQLLSHTSGVTWTGQPLAFAPGSQFAYSNYGYLLLGDILASVTGQTYNARANQLFAQLKMPQTVSYKPETGIPTPKQLATGYAEQDNHGVYTTDDSLLWHLAPSAGGIISTVPDLLHWNQALHKGQLLTDRCYALMVHPYANRPNRWGTLGYGYGVQVDSIDGLKEISHGGYFPGFISTLLYYPASGTSVIILNNISPDSKDMERAFYYHDEIRKMVRKKLLNERGNG
jgi:CubicO group peptidase (beta-lactamase class C family)